VDTPLKNYSVLRQNMAKISVIMASIEVILRVPRSDGWAVMRQGVFPRFWIDRFVRAGIS
jgi:hypothetical protein